MKFHGDLFRYGLKLVSSSEFKISVVSLLGIAGFVLALKDCKIGSSSCLPWLPEKEGRSEKLVRVPGLQNLGNNCFLNVILQALASSPCFQSFLEKVIEECDSSEDAEQVESLPLTVALASLLKDLSAASSERIVLSPRNVMLAMVLYIPNFNLTSQQDAAEAFLHLLSSLRDEFSDCYRPGHISFADVSASRRILASTRREDQSEQERWRQNFLGSFDGVLGSILNCQSCSSQISLDFEFFHSLPLSPVCNGGATSLFGYTLEDCMKQFFAAERVENYKCSHCWHIAGIKYLSVIGANEMEIEKLKSCSDEDHCDCQSLIHLEKLPWTNKFSCAIKQLSIAHCPKILCIHLQRASINAFGEIVKLQGHISFPLILDLLPFVTSGVGWEQNLQRENTKQQYQKHIPHLNNLNVEFDTSRLNGTSGSSGNNIDPNALAVDEYGCPVDMQPFQVEPNLAPPNCCSHSMNSRTHMQSDEKVSLTCRSASSKSHLYRLVSVVEHFGRSGSGHYTIYRSVRSEQLQEHPSDKFEPDLVQWFSISDSEVYSVSEKDVLAAEASLLFYERILED